MARDDDNASLAW